MDNELKPVNIQCDYQNMPTRYRKISLPASIMRLVRYRHLHIQSSKIENLEAIVAYFLTTDPRYCRYFEVLEVQEDDPLSQEKETPTPIIAAVELPEPASKETETDGQKEPAKKQTAKKKAAKKPAKRRPKAKKEDSDNG